jgi:hypothetical protein
MKHNDNTDWKIRAENIYTVLQKIASEKPIRIGRSSISAIPKAVEAIKKSGFRKPLFVNPELWVKRLIVRNKEAYIQLSPHIKLEFIVDGKARNWRGNGFYLDFKRIRESFEKGGFKAEQKFPPIWLQINLSFEYEPFSKILDDIPRTAES